MATAAATVLLAGCASAEPEAQPTQDAVLTEYGLDGKDAVEVIDELDRVALDDRATDLMASVRVDELVLTDADGAETAMDLPDDRFYLSVAPYVDTTHECFYHSLTTCKGELGGEDVRLRVVDDAGEVLVDETTTTFDNGFVGMWLPRDIEGTLEVEYDGKTGTADIGTGEDDPTCLTTLQLT